jgi:anti-sigma factor RsiW
MQCDEARVALYACEDGELDAAGRSDLVGHLERCGACRRERQADRRVRGLVRRLSFALPGAPPDLWPRLIDRLEMERPPAPTGGRRGPASIRRVVWRTAIAVVALAATVILGVSLPLTRSSSTSAQLLDELVRDHVASLQRAGGPADVPSGDPTVVLTRFADRISGLAVAPYLGAGTGALVGGSYCQLRTTSGLRWTYRLHGNRTLSFYQLTLPPRGDFPRPRAERITLAGGFGRPELVLWTDEGSVYALVGALPEGEMKALATRF